MLIDYGEKVTLVTDCPMIDTKGQPSLVILGIYKRQKMKSEYVNQVRTVYPLDDFVAQLIKAGENDKLIIIDKNKVNEQLARIGIQPSERDNIINLAKDSISQNTDNVNNNSSVPESHSVAIPFSEEAKGEKLKKYVESIVKNTVVL